MHALKIAFRRVFVAALFSMLAVSLGMAQGTPAASHYTFTTFTVPGAVRLFVQSINSAGTVSGWFTDASGDSESFLRTADGTITTYVDPNNTGTPYNTAAYQINRSGIAAGGFFDTVRGAYSGFFYETSSGTFKTYNPKGTSVTIRGLNDKGNFCGIAYTSPLNITWNSFTNFGGTINYFSVNGSTQSFCAYLNDPGAAVGIYTSAGVAHGWLGNSTGPTSYIDYPGAASVLGNGPCGGLGAGTYALGINNHGAIVGHYFDSSYNQHGFTLDTSGNYHELNVPGAYQSSAAGINGQGVIVGNYNDSSCNSIGYIATPAVP